MHLLEAQRAAFIAALIGEYPNAGVLANAELLKLYLEDLGYAGDTLVALQQWAADNSIPQTLALTRAALGGAVSIVSDGVLSPLATFTRSSTATYFDSTGVLQTAAIDTPRIDYDPVTHALRGLLIEEQRTNLLLNSASLSTQSVTVTAVAHTLSFTGTGTVTLSGASTAGPLVGTGAGNRVTLTFTPSAGTLTVTVSGSVTLGQLEAGAFATSYIPTTSAAVTRADENATINGLANVRWNEAEGTVLAEFAPVFSTFDTTRAFVSRSLDGRFIYGTSGTTMSIYDGTTVRGIGPMQGSGVFVKAASTYGPGGLYGAVNGVPSVVSPFDGIFGSGDSFYLGQLSAGGRVVCGTLRNVRYYPRQLSSTELQELTTPAFSPSQLFANGEQGWWIDVADLDTVFTDTAGTTRVQNIGDLIARVSDKSGNGNHFTKAVSGSRMALNQLPTSRRPYADSTGSKTLSLAAPTLSNCTVVRLFASGPTIQTGQSISGTITRTQSTFGEIVLNRDLTSDELAALTIWTQQRCGTLDELNVQYGADATNELMDVYHSSGSDTRAIVIMTHGGGWRNGDKLLSNVVQNKFQCLIPKGITCVSVNYKLDVGTDPIDQARSVAKAIAYVQAHAEAWGCNPKNVILMGHSAGAHLTNLVASDATMRSDAGITNWLATVLLDSAAYNVSTIMNDPTHWSGYDEPFSGGQSQWDAASPTLVLSGKVPPTLCIVSDWPGAHGEDDAANTQEWVDKASSFGTTVVRRDTPLDHGDVNNLLGMDAANPSLAADPTYTTDFLAFLLARGVVFAV